MCQAHGPLHPIDLAPPSPRNSIGDENKETSSSSIPLRYVLLSRLSVCVKVLHLPWHFEGAYPPLAPFVAVETRSITPLLCC